MAYARKTHVDRLLQNIEALEYLIETGGAGYDAIVTALEAMEVAQIAGIAGGKTLNDLNNRLVAIQTELANIKIRVDLTPKDATGEKLTAASANTDYQTTGALSDGNRYSITAEDGVLHIGYDTSTTAGEVVMAIPAGTTRSFIWSGNVDLHYSSPTAGTIGRLSELEAS